MTGSSLAAPPSFVRRLAARAAQGPATARASFATLAFTLALGAAAVPTAALATDNRGPDPRPLAGACTTSFAFTGPSTARIDGNCTFRRIGRATFVASQVITPRDDGSLFITNSVTYTAANGDQLFSNFVGVGVNTTAGAVSFSGTETFRRGTGRFAAALGGVAVTGTAQFTSPAGGVGEFQLLGLVAY